MQADGWPGVVVLDGDALHAGGNLHFGLQGEQTPFGKHKPPETDLFVDSRFAGLVADWRKSVDVRLTTGSPAVDLGVPTPDDWPDPLREKDAGQPDIGALPLGMPSAAIGPSGD